MCVFLLPLEHIQTLKVSIFMSINTREPQGWSPLLSGVGESVGVSVGAVPVGKCYDILKAYSNCVLSQR